MYKSRSIERQQNGKAQVKNKCLKTAIIHFCSFILAFHSHRCAYTFTFIEVVFSHKIFHFYV